MARQKMTEEQKAAAKLAKEQKKEELQKMGILTKSELMDKTLNELIEIVLTLQKETAKAKEHEEVLAKLKKALE